MLGGRRTRHDWKLALDDAEKAEIEQEIEDSESFESSAAVTLERRENCRKDLEAGWEGPGSVWKAPLPALTSKQHFLPWSSSSFQPRWQSSFSSGYRERRAIRAPLPNARPQGKNTSLIQP
jgi:hypothetical protein